MEHCAGNVEAAVAEFYYEFAAFEDDSLGAALRSLSDDAVFVRQSKDLLECDARLDLLRRLALASRVPAPLSSELDAILREAKRLSERRSELLHAVWPGVGIEPLEANFDGETSGPTSSRARFVRMQFIPQLDTYAEQARDLKRALGDLAVRMDAHRRDG